jgi:hypothetical protein
MDIHGDQNENERIDTDITETQQWKVSECFVRLSKSMKKIKLYNEFFSHHQLNVCCIWN